MSISTAPLVSAGSFTINTLDISAASRVGVESRVIMDETVPTMSPSFILAERSVEEATTNRSPLDDINPGYMFTLSTWLEPSKKSMSDWTQSGAV